MPRDLPPEVNVVYIDCDLAKGTQEVLDSVLPRLRGVVFSQDYGIGPVRELLDRYKVTRLSEQLARVWPS